MERRSKLFKRRSVMFNLALSVVPVVPLVIIVWAVLTQSGGFS
jgi:hypothetical protein